MKLRLTRPARINFMPGDIVEVSPEQASFLIGVCSAEPVLVEKKEAIETPEAKKTVKRTVKK